MEIIGLIYIHIGVLLLHLPMGSGPREVGELVFFYNRDKKANKQTNFNGVPFSI